MSNYLNYDQLIAQYPEFDSPGDNRAWLQQRMGKFTASTFHKLLTPTYKPAESEKANDYILEKVAEHLGVPQPQATGRAIQWGNDQEPAAIERLQESFPQLEANKEFIMSADFPHWVGATPDTIIYDKRGRKTATIQIKCPYNPINHLKHRQITTQLELKKAHQEYYTQLQFEMWVLGVKKGFFASFDPRFPEHKQLHLVEVTSDEELLNTIKQVLQIAILKVKSHL